MWSPEAPTSAGSRPDAPIFGLLRGWKQIYPSVVGCRDGVCGVWSGLVWCGVVWCGLVWSGLVWSGLVWSGPVWSGLVWSGLVRAGLGGIVTGQLVSIQIPTPKYTQRQK